MAAIDPDEVPEFEDGAENQRPRATLKLVRPPPGLDLDESDEEDESDEDSEDDDEVNGGPSDKERARQLKKAAAQKALEEAMAEDDDEEDGDDDDDFDLKAAISKLVKGKGPATDDDEDDESDEGLDLDEMVICTLDPERVSLRRWFEPWVLTNTFCGRTSNSPWTSPCPRMSACSSR